METKNILLGLLIVAVFGVGFMVGRLGNGVTTLSQDDKNTPSGNSPTTTNGDVAAEGNTSISTSNLTDGQKKMLSALGIDAESVTVTPEMIVCAETSLGASRMDEIINGDTPSFTEGAKLVACYK